MPVSKSRPTLTERVGALEAHVARLEALVVSGLPSSPRPQGVPSQGYAKNFVASPEVTVTS